MRIHTITMHHDVINSQMLPHSLSGGLRFLVGFRLIGTVLVLGFGTVYVSEVVTLAGAGVTSWLVDVSESGAMFSGGYDTKADASGFSNKSDMVFSVVVDFLRIWSKCRLICE